MRLADVDDEECDPITEARVQGLEVPSLGTERGSGVAAEDQRDGPLPAERREPHALVAVAQGELEVRCERADLRRVCLASRDELQHRRTLARLHPERELLQSREIDRREALLEHLLERHVALRVAAPRRTLSPCAAGVNIFERLLVGSSRSNTDSGYFDA